MNTETTRAEASENNVLDYISIFSRNIDLLADTLVSSCTTDIFENLAQLKA